METLQTPQPISLMNISFLGMELQIAAELFFIRHREEWGIEVTPGTLASCEYAAIGNFANGCFISFLDILGMPLAGKTFYFHAPTRSAQPYNGAIGLQEPGTAAGTGYFYITGSFLEPPGQWTMYMLKVDINGTILWSALHQLGNVSTSLRPLHMTVSPYTGPGSPELVVVGQANNGSSTNNDAFFMRVDGNTGNVLNFNIYNTVGSPAADVLLSVSPALSISSLGSPGYIVGGYSGLYNHPGVQQWAAIVDQTGSSFGWNTVLTTAATPNGGIIFRILERLNTSGSYEYYATAGGGGSMVVVKIDDFGGIPPGSSEYHYSNAAGNVFAIDLTLTNNTPNVGIQVYGNDWSNHYLVQSCFNGVSGCIDSETQTAWTLASPGPGNIILNASLISQFSSMVVCPNFFITASAIQVVPAHCGPFWTIPSGGSNARTTSVGKASSQKLSIFPNPIDASHSILNIQGIGFSEVKSLSITDALGKEIHLSISDQQLSDNSLQLQLNKTKLASGLYIMKISTRDAREFRELIYINP